MPRTKILLGVTVDISLVLLEGFPGYLLDHGWEVHIVSSPGPDLDRIAAMEGLTVHALPMAREPDLFKDLRSFIGWLRVLRRVRPDVISIGTPKASLLGIVAGALTRVPGRVYLLRGLRLETLGGAKRRILGALERITMASSVRVVAVSASLRAEVLARKLCSPRKVVVLGDGSSNGVNMERFDRQIRSEQEVRDLAREIGIVPKVPTIGFVGRLTEDKGLKTLAAARRILVARGIDHQLLLVGGIDELSDGSGVRDLRRIGRPPIEVGRVRETEKYYQLIDVLCLPTRREGFPNVVLEAAAAGVPTVTTDATGAVDSVVDGETGRITRRDDPAHLAEALGQLLGDQHQRARWGEAARRRAAEGFANNRVWALQEGLYRQLLEEGRHDV